MAKSSNKLVIYNSLSTILLYAITFFSAPLFSRMLGVDNYGTVQVYNTWISFFSIVIGLQTRGTISIAKVHYDGERFEQYQSSILFLSLSSFFIISTITLVGSKLLLPFFGLDVRFLMLMLIHSFGNYCIAFMNTKFIYDMKAGTNLILSVFMAVITFGLSYILVGLFRNQLYAGRILGLAVPYCVVGFCAMLYIFQKGKIFFDAEYWKFCLPLCLPLIFHGISGIICASSDRIMLSGMLNATAVGIYSLAYNFANIMNSIWEALNHSWVPFFYDFVKNNQLDEIKKRSGNYIKLYTCLTMGFILLSPDVFHYFASEEYWEGAKIIPLIALSSYATFLYSFGANYEFCYKRTDIVAIGSICSGMANIIMNYFFIRHWGYFGAALATSFSYGIQAVIHFSFAKKIVKDKWVYSLNMFLPGIVATVWVAMIFYICYTLWFIRWGIAIIVGFYMFRTIYINKAIF